MGGPRILSDGQIELMCDLREQGWSCRRIARRFAREGTAVSVGSISWQCLRQGAYPPKFNAPPRRSTEPALRNGHLVRPFSQEDDDRLLTLEAEGLNYSEIARRLGRAPNSIRGRFYTLARHEAMAEASAE